MAKANSITEDAAREEWRAIPGWEGKYEASSQGRIRSCRTNHILTPYEDRGYLHVHFGDRANRKRPSVHRLVCLAFHGPAPEGHLAAHADGTKQNNASTNLRWATPKENSEDAKRHGVTRNGSYLNSHLSDQDIRAIRAAVLDRSTGVTLVGLGRKYGVHMNSIWKIRARHTWAQID